MTEMMMTTQHEWVMHTVTPVSVLPDDDGEPVIFVDPDDAAEARSVYGCNRCGEAMTHSHDKPCAGESSDDG